MKNCFKLVIASILFAALATGCEKNNNRNDVQVAVTGVVLDDSTIELTVGDTKTLTATVIPENAADKGVVWKSGDGQIADVDDEGTVTAVSEGSTVITVQTKDGGFEAECAITVNKAVVPVTSISTAWKRYFYEVGEKFAIAVVLQPSDATRDLEWTSSNTAIVSVDPDGVAEAVAPGAAVVTVKDRNGDVEAEIGLTILPVPSTAHCEDAAPHWGETLGDITFRTDKVWEIGDQLWSDVVLTSVCSVREDFVGAPNNSTEVLCTDCRKGHDGYGNLFTQCAVVKYRKELCPDGWRVPTAEDMVALNKALGGDGKNIITWGTPEGQVLLGRYISEWGAELSGNCTPLGVMPPVGYEGYYWTQTQHDYFESTGGRPNNAIYTGLKKNGSLVYATYASVKSYGMALRCVR